jgi:hypothetical protein
VIDKDEIIRSLNAAWLLFLDRPNAIRNFDASYQGFWRSFQAIVLILPIYALTVYSEWQSLLADPVISKMLDQSAYMAAAWVTLAVDWVALPLLLAGLAQFLSIRQGYASYVVARNWSAVLMAVPYGLISLLQLAQPGLGDFLFIPLVIALAIALRFSYLIARRALAVTLDVAIGFVALDVLVRVGLAEIISRLFGLDGGGA